jgi:hypothetical protein
MRSGGMIEYFAPSNQLQFISGIAAFLVPQSAG